MADEQELPYRRAEPSNFEECVKFAGEFFPSRPQIKTPSLLTPLTAFLQNAARVRSSIMVYPFITFFATEIQRVGSVAEFEITGKVQVVPSGPDKKKDDEIKERFRKLWKESNARESEIMKSPRFVELMAARTEDSFRRLAMFIEAPALQMTLGLEALYSSLILGAWTTFETLAGDLWEIAINTHPSGLAELQGNARRLRKGKPSTSPSAQEKSQARDYKTIPLNLIQMHQYNLQNHMGTILRNKYNFDILDGIREAYGSAFETSPKIDAILNNDALDALSAVRNLLVHKAGVVDKEYAGRIKHLKIPQAAEGEAIKLDGKVATTLARPVLKLTHELLIAVDDWLDTN